MNAKLRDRLLKLTYGDVVDWVGEAVAARGFNYRDRVGEIGELPDGYAAHVQGTNSYVTNLYADEYGEFCSVCSCPVGVNCKHGAALAQVVAEKLRAALPILPVSDGALTLDRDEVIRRVREKTQAKQARHANLAERFNPFAPIPSFAPDFARAFADGPIRFPNNRFVTNMWPNIRCRTAEEVRNALASFRLEGRKLEGVRLFGDSSSSDEASILADAGVKVEGTSECRAVRRAYAQLPLTAKVSRSVETNRLVRIAFDRGGTFEIDAEQAPDFYLAMNQIDAGTRPESPVNVDGEILFSSLSGRRIERVEVLSSLHERGPFFGESYDEPKELADAIVFRLDTGDGLRFRTEWHDLIVDVVNADGIVKKTSWESVKAAFYNRADVNIDPVTGVESRSGSLYFGLKGEAFAEYGRVAFRTIKRSLSGGCCIGANIRRDHAAFFALADYVLRPTLKPGNRELSRREWEAFLVKVRQLMNDGRFRTAGNRASVLAGAFRNSYDLTLLDDIERWSQKTLDEDGRMRIEGLASEWSSEVLNWGQPKAKSFRK